MSIDPNTLPDGTVVETSDGVLHFKDGGGRQISRWRLSNGYPFRWSGRTIVRTYTPDPTPDQEVPRDEWANIAVGSRVRIVEVNGDEHTVTIRDAESDQWLWTTDHGYDPRKVARVYLLDAPTPPDPDAELVEVMGRVFVPVPDGMTYADAEAALADAGAWVDLGAWVDAGATDDAPKGARIREEWTGGNIAATLRRWVHRDDLPPTDPDAELVEKMARASHDVTYDHSIPLDKRPTSVQDMYRNRARAALAVVREHEARS